MSGDSTFGNSNMAAASSLSDPDERDENGTLEKLEASSQASTNSQLDQSANAEWQKNNAAMVAKLLSNIGDSVYGTLPDSPEKRSSRWRQKLSTQGKDAVQRAKKAEQHFNLLDDSIDAAEQKFRNRRRPFSRNQNQRDREKKWREAAAAALNDTLNDTQRLSLNDTNESQEAEQIVYKKPRSFSQRVHAFENKNAEKQVTQNVNAFDVTDSSIEEQQTRRTRGFSNRYRTSSKGKVNPDYFDITDESLVADKPPVQESKKRRFSRYERKVTEADINAFDVTDEDEKADGSQREEELVLELDEEGAGGDNGNLEEEGANNSMDESEKSGDEADDDRNQTLEIQSSVEEAGGEDSLDEEVDEAEMESRKSDRNVSNKCEEENDEGEKQKDAVAAEGDSCIEQSSLLLEYQLSTDNHSESRVFVAEIQNRSASLVSNTSMTVDKTMASRGSRRFTQHGSQFLDVVEDRVKSRLIGSQNFETSFDSIGSVLNVSSNSGKNSRSLRNESRADKNKSITEKESGDVSMDVVNESQQDVDELENSKRSLRNKRGRREEDGSKENEKRGEVSINVSKQGSDEADGIKRSLRDTSAAKRLLNKTVTEDRTSKERRRESANKSVTEESSSKENNVQEEADEERGNNRSLRNRSVAKGKSNRSVSGDQNSKRNFDDSFNSVHDSVGFVSNARTTRRASMAASKDDTGESSPDENIKDSLRSSVATNRRSGSKNNSRVLEGVSPGSGSAEVGDGSPDTGNGRPNAMHGVTYSSEEIVGQNRDLRSKETSLLYNSLDSFGDEQRSSVSMLQIPQNRNESAMINNSLDSTVNATRHDPTPDEMMPAPRCLPARKRRLANVDTPSFSSLAQKKKRNAVGQTDSIVGLVEKQNDQVAVNNNQEVMVTKVHYKCPKLKKPEPWATKRLYDWIIERLEPRYKLRSRLRAEEFVLFLCSTVKTVIKKKENYEKDIEDLKYEMARLNLIENKFQFFMFIYKFLPWQFENKSLPLSQSCITGPVVTFEKGTLYDPIL